jgi:transposase
MEGLMAGRHDLSEKEWSAIAPLLPSKPRGVARVDDRRVISGIFYILRTVARSA